MRGENPSHGLEANGVMSETTTQELIALAWQALPASHRRLLEQVGASRWEIVDRPLGEVTTELLQGPDRPPRTRVDIEGDNKALGIWVPELRLVLINEEHSAVLSADPATRERLLTWVAWHEWGHALSLASNDPHDPSEGARLLALAPPGIRERIRRANYPRREYLHELIAETYALPMRTRVEGRPGWRGVAHHFVLPSLVCSAHITLGASASCLPLATLGRPGEPTWLPNEIYQLITRIGA